MTYFNKHTFPWRQRYLRWSELEVSRLQPEEDDYFSFDDDDDYPETQITSVAEQLAELRENFRYTGDSYPVVYFETEWHTCLLYRRPMYEAAP